MSERHREVQFWRVSSVVTLHLCSVRDLSKDAAKKKTSVFMLILWLSESKVQGWRRSPHPLCFMWVRQAVGANKL